MKKIKEYLIALLDPHQQSFVFFRWSPFRVVLVLAAAVCLTYLWRNHFVKMLMYNSFVGLPNFLSHEMFGHNFLGKTLCLLVRPVWPALGIWLLIFMGNGGETLLPLLACWLVLRIEGGRWVFPITLYWLSTTLYDAGVYVQDARACSLPLASADMITDYKPGEICGDWHNLLEPIGLLNYDQWFAYTFLFIASLLFVLAIYSAWYYWAHPNFYNHINVDSQPALPAWDPNWQPPNIHTPQQINVPGGRNQ